MTSSASSWVVREKKSPAATTALVALCFFIAGVGLVYFGWSSIVAAFELGGSLGIASKTMLFVTIGLGISFLFGEVLGLNRTAFGFFLLMGASGVLWMAVSQSDMAATAIPTVLIVYLAVPFITAKLS